MGRFSVHPIFKHLFHVWFRSSFEQLYLCPTAKRPGQQNIGRQKIEFQLRTSGWWNQFSGDCWPHLDTAVPPLLSLSSCLVPYISGVPHIAFTAYALHSFTWHCLNSFLLWANPWYFTKFPNFAQIVAFSVRIHLNIVLTFRLPTRSASAGCGSLLSSGDWLINSRQTGSGLGCRDDTRHISWHFSTLSSYQYSSSSY